MQTITFAEINARVAEHYAAEAARNAPAAVVVRAIETLFAALAECEPTERAELIVLLGGEIRAAIRELSTA